MRFSKLLNTLQNLIGFTPKQSDIGKILNMGYSTINGRYQRDSDFSDEEIEKIEEHYGISLRGGDNNSVEIEYININPSCGHGTIVLDDADIIPVRIGKELIQDVWKANPKDLKLFKASGDSMQPIIEDGDILLVNTARTDFQNGGIFLLTIENDWFIKRLRLRVDGILEIISENERYLKEVVPRNATLEIKIYGRVIKNLSRGL